MCYISAWAVWDDLKMAINALQRKRQVLDTWIQLDISCGQGNQSVFSSLVPVSLLGAWLLCVTQRALFWDIFRNGHLQYVINLNTCLPPLIYDYRSDVSTQADPYLTPWSLSLVVRRRKKKGETSTLVKWPALPVLTLCKDWKDSDYFFNICIWKTIMTSTADHIIMVYYGMLPQIK